MQSALVCYGYESSEDNNVFLIFIDFYITACEKRKGPILTDPFPQNQTISAFGGNVTFECAGDFGCTDPSSLDLILWLINNSPVKENSTKYLVKKATIHK